jgi:hypothetical protein
MCFEFVYNFCLEHFSTQEEFREINVKSLHAKCSSCLSKFNETWIFSIEFRKKAQISSFIKIRPVRAKLFHEHRQTDMTKLKVDFVNFANAPKMISPRSTCRERIPWNFPYCSIPHIQNTGSYWSELMPGLPVPLSLQHITTQDPRYKKRQYQFLRISSSSISFYNPLAGFSLLILEVSRSHTTTHHSR